MKELTLEEAALAWAQGKRVEAVPRLSKTWLPISPVGFVMRGHFSPSVFGDSTYSFRLAAKKKGIK